MLLQSEHVHHVRSGCSDLRLNEVATNTSNLAELHVLLVKFYSSRQLARVTPKKVLNTVTVVRKQAAVSFCSVYCM